MFNEKYLCSYLLECLRYLLISLSHCTISIYISIFLLHHITLLQGLLVFGSPVLLNGHGDAFFTILFSKILCKLYGAIIFYLVDLKNICVRHPVSFERFLLTEVKFWSLKTFERNYRKNNRKLEIIL